MVLALVACLAPGVADAAIIKTLTTASQLLPNSAVATNINLAATADLTKTFVICSTRTTNATPNIQLATCDLNSGGGTPRLSITPSAAPGLNTTTVTYYVAEFAAGVSVQRGSASFSGAALVPTAAVTLGTAVDCTKSFVLLSVRSTDNSSARDELETIRGFLATGGAPCTSGTTTSLDLSRNLGQAGTTVTVQWQVVTYEGASVQRGNLCIGAAGTCPPNGGTAGGSTRLTLGTAVDTTKSFILLTAKGGSASVGIDGENNVRGEWLATGASVTGVNFARSLTVITANHQVDIAWEVVSLSDGSTVQTSGAAPTTVIGATAAGSPNLASVIDTTRTVPFFSVSGGDNNATRLDDTMFTGVANGSNAGATASSLTFTRGSTTNVGTNSIAWYAVSFFRCNTASGVAYDTLCTVGSSIAGTTAIINWSSVNTVLIVGSTTNSFTTPTNGTSPGLGSLVGTATVVYNGALASDTLYTGTAPAGISYFKIWAKGGAAGTCNTVPCYVGGAQGSVTTTSAPTTWASIVLGGAALNPAVAGTLSGAARVSLGSNAGKLSTLDSSNGAWDSVPASTVGAVQGYLSLFPYGATEMLIGGDQSGWVYSVDPNTGAYNWIVKLNADAIQAAVTMFLRSGFSAAMTAAYPGTYDIVFVATKNNQASGGYTNNKVFALRADTGATLWTFSPATLAVAPCPSGCPMDQVLGQPWVDYSFNRLYVTSRHGSGAGGQNSIWVLDVINSGALLAKFASGDITTGPVVLYDETRLLVGNEAGSLRIIDLTALTETTNGVAAGTAFKGFIWEDFTVSGKIYFVTTDGNVWCLPSPSSGSQCWTKVKPVAAGTVNQMLPSDIYLWVGGSNGTLYQLSLATGAIAKTYAVGSGLSLAPVTTETGTELYVAASDGTLYKIALTGASLP